MALTPLSVAIGSKLLIKDKTVDVIEENYEGAGSDVLMIGFSRYGQIASQILLAGGIDVTVIDSSPNRVRAAGKFGFRIYFGDGTRKDVLEAAGIRKAKIVAVCTHKKETTNHIVNLIQSEYPDVRLFVRSYDREHTLQLRAQGVEYELRETFESGLLFGQRTLEARHSRNASLWNPRRCAPARRGPSPRAGFGRNSGRASSAFQQAGHTRASG